MPEGLSPFPLTSQQRKQKTLDVLTWWLLEETEKAPVYAVWEDLHCADPSTLEFLELCLDHTPPSRTLMVLTFRPEFTRLWTPRSYLSHLVLSRLGRPQSRTLVEGVTGGKALLLDAITRARTLSGLADLILAVTVGNERARAFYLAVGFTSVTIEPRYLKIGEQYFDIEWMHLSVNGEHTSADNAA